MASDQENKTVGTRVLLHLSRYSRFQTDEVCPPQMSTLGIAEALGIRREHVSMELVRLRRRGYVSSKRAHMIGSGLNRKIYFPTPLGEVVARQLRGKNVAAVEEWIERNEHLLDETRLKPEPARSANPS